MRTHVPLRKENTPPLRESFVRNDYDNAWTAIFVDELLRRADLKEWLDAHDSEIQEEINRIFRTLMTPRNRDFRPLEALFGDIKPTPTARAVRELLQLKDSPKLREYNFLRLARRSRPEDEDEDVDSEQMARDEKEDPDERWDRGSGDRIGHTA